MKDRDALIFALTRFARRLRLNAVLCEFARMACAILGALVLYQILAAAIAAPAVLNALATLLALVLIAVIGFFVLRTLRPIALDEAAATLDARMDLKDELKTGYWFARQRKVSPLVELQIHRAVLTAQRMIPSEVFPITIARSAFAAVGLAFAAGVLSWFAPYFGHSQSPFADSIGTEFSLKPVMTLASQRFTTKDCLPPIAVARPLVQDKNPREVLNIENPL